MNDESEREGITLGDLWKMMKKRLWLILVVTVVAALGTFFAMKLFINPAAIYYTMEFTLNYPGKEELKYPDGTPFYYQDVVSADMLSRAKASNAKFSNIDVDKLTSEDLITISVVMEDEETEEIEQYTEIYTIKVSQKYFSTRELATEFLRTVANAPVEYVKERAAALNYSLDVNSYDSAYSFLDRMELLAAERIRILEQYDSWIKIFHESYPVSDRPLKDYRSDVEILFSETMQEDLKNELTIYDYVPAERMEAKIAELRAERASNEKKIVELEAVMNNVSEKKTESMEAVAKELAALKVENVDIDRKLETLTEENIAAFDAVLDNEYAKLEEAAALTRRVAVALYGQETRATFSFSRAVQEGGSNSAIITIGAAVIAFLATSVIVCCVQYPKFLAEKTKKTKDSKDEEEA